MLVSGFMHSRDRGYSGSAPETGPYRCGTAPDSHRTSPARRLSAFAVGRVYLEEQVRERQDLLRDGHPHRSEVAVFSVSPPYVLCTRQLRNSTYQIATRMDASSPSTLITSRTKWEVTMVRRVFLAFLVFGVTACGDDGTGTSNWEISTITVYPNAFTLKSGGYVWIHARAANASGRTIAHQSFTERAHEPDGTVAPRQPEPEQHPASARQHRARSGRHARSPLHERELHGRGRA